MPVNIDKMSVRKENADVGGCRFRFALRAVGRG